MNNDAMNILVVDDEDRIRRLLRMYLRARKLYHY